MKILYLSIIAIALVMPLLIPVLAQNGTAPTIWFDHASYATREMSCYSDETGKISGQEQKTATITVTDQTANKYSASIDRVTVYVWSDSDRKGIQITAYETDVNSGIFKGTVTITEGQSTQDLIHVRDGDTITAKYTGSNPWSAGTQSQGVTTTAFIGVNCPPLERIPASGINITDNEGNQQKTILVNKQIQIGSKLDNITIRNQTFAYIVQISDEHQNVASLSSVSGLLLPSQTFSPSVSWTPLKAGSYTVQIFVWQSINNPNSLSPPLTSELSVLPYSSAPNSTTSFENHKCQTGYEFVARPGSTAPVCVTPETAQKLIERGWATNISQTNSPTDLASDTGLVTLGNKTYYFETPNYTKNAYVNPTSVLFHNVNFALFPSGFRGGLPIPCNLQGSDQYYWTDAKFTDTTHELLHIQVDSPPCTANPIPSMFSTHTDPQAGLAFYDGKMKLLVSTDVTNPRLDFTTNSSSIQSGHAIGISISLENTSPEPLTLAVQNHWQRNDLSLGSCSNLPIGIAILKGYYTEQNMSEAGSLWLYPNLPCPMPLGITGYTFQPMSNVATRECSPSFSCHDSIAIEGNLTIGGYLSGNGNVTPFESGTYTIVGGDEWGDVAIQHFTVTNSTGMSVENQTSQTVPPCVSDIPNQYATAGPPGFFMCPLAPFQASGQIVNSTGFFGIYNYTKFQGTKNFVLEPGHNGTISYKISMGSIRTLADTTPTNKINVTNYVQLMHDANMYDHPGVYVSVYPRYETIPANGSALLTITLAASKDASHGTYWVHLPPGVCSGGEAIILTITDCSGKK